MLRRLLFLLLFFVLSFKCHAQLNLGIASDTIITKTDIFGSTYLLNGKQLTLPVMEWFMQDYPASYDAIQPAKISDQLSVAVYSGGSVFLLGGLLVDNRDRKLRNNLLLMGGITISGGILLQYVSTRFQKRAIRLYNMEVKKRYQASNVYIDFGLTPNGVGVQITNDK